MARLALKLKSQKKNKYKVRDYHRCKMCGRSRGYLRLFGLCRLCFREQAHKGNLPGVAKASW